MMVFIAGCTSAGPASEAAAAVVTATATATDEPVLTDVEPTVATEPPATTPVPVAPTARPTPTLVAPTPVPATSVPSATSEPTQLGPAPGCVRITDFALDTEVVAWFVVNDDVMGGRSAGSLDFTDSAAQFTGSINTDGGGFSSIRVNLRVGALDGFDRVVIRARTDGRGYKLTLDDSVATRDRRVSHQGDLRFAPGDDWQTVSVVFADLQARIFGRDVAAEPFRPDFASQLGFIISDGIDGPFRLEVDWIDACVA